MFSIEILQMLFDLWLYNILHVPIVLLGIFHAEIGKPSLVLGVTGFLPFRDFGCHLLLNFDIPFLALELLELHKLLFGHVGYQLLLILLRLFESYYFLESLFFFRTLVGFQGKGIFLGFLFGLLKPEFIDLFAIHGTQFISLRLLLLVLAAAGGFSFQAV